MNKWMKDHQKILIILFFPYLFLLFLLVTPTKFSLTAPGGLTPVYENVMIETKDISQNFYTIYVVSYHPMTPFQKMVSDVSERISVTRMTKTEEDTSWKEQYLQGQITKEVSLNTSVIKAYELAHLKDDSIRVEYTYQGAYVYYRPSRIEDLEIGDVVVAINGQSLLDMSYTQFINLFYSLSTVSLEISRNIDSGKITKTIEYQKLDDESWMYFYPKYDIVNTQPKIEYTNENPWIGGPSGGMIQTLSIYSGLLNLNFGDVKIAGTGTIEIDGSIGKIGGIVQKLYTAMDEKADIFIYPSGHISDIPNLSFPYEMVAVSTIEEAVNWLHENFE
ncbi:MAG: hypothetical protein JXC35_01520 [Acholeplasmataceae bacterium]|nr:hypothetical protein [Acholeplasmataceae bacterium]